MGQKHIYKKYKQIKSSFLTLDRDTWKEDSTKEKNNNKWKSKTKKRLD